MPRSWKKRLTELLQEKKLLTQGQLDKGLQIHREKGGSLGKVLIDEGYISQRDLMMTVSKELNIPPINLSRYRVDPEVLNLVPYKLAKHYSLIPISKMGNALVVAMSDPLNILAIDEIKRLTKFEIDPVIATEESIQKTIEAHYDLAKGQLSEILEEFRAEGEALEVVKEGEEEVQDIAAIEKESEAAPIVKIVNIILNEALRSRASDIHIEPERDTLRIRYRIDGDLHETLQIPKKNQNAILARLKILSGLDITETRVPQDGRFKIDFEDRQIDFRVSVLPVGFGGKVVLRALDKSKLSVGLDKFKSSPGALKSFKEAVSKPYGMVLVTGPTGSGKSTTLYSILNFLNTPDRAIITIEDPVEYQIEGLTQIQVNSEIGLTFASGLRSLLRQSPDVIMVGEIRDLETADIAIKASLTGQILFSTLHTNDAASAITRLIDMGVEPFLIAASLVGVCAQRLCRKVCPDCKEPYELPKSVRDKLDLKPQQIKDGAFFRAKGCKRCADTGYYDRIAIIEFLTVDDNIREMIVKRASSDQIKAYAVERGMRTLRADALDKASQGITTLEEVLRVTGEE